MATEAENMEVDETKAEASTDTSEKKKKDESKADDGPPHYRVKISGLPRFYNPVDPLLIDFKKLLTNDFKLDFKYIRSPKKGNSWLYITFHNQEDQAKALKLLKHYSWKGRTLISTLVVADVLKRKQDDGGQEASKRPRLEIPVEEQMLMSTIPYHTISYEEQLSKKNEEAECLFKWLAECIEKKAPKLIGYIDKQIEKNRANEIKPIKKKLPFKLDEVKSATVIDGYRNKCEFRIGTNPQTKEIVVGYRVDNQEGDNIAVAPPDTLRHLPAEMIAVVKVFEEYVRASPYPPQIVTHDTGVWRLLHVRINRNKQLMVVVLINPTVLTDGQLAQMKKDLVTYFTVGEASGHKVVSLYFHTDNDVKITPTLGGGDKMKKPQGELELLWGEKYLYEKLLDLDLEIDPNFYFQNNTWGAEELYKAVMELAGVDEETTVLDLCCGSGGMGMIMAKHCKEVIGVEVMDVNVDDAKRLAAKNGLTNCEFIQGSVDDLMPMLEEKLKGKKVVPILDPPRVGISKRMIAFIRKMKEVNHMVYVSSNHKPPVKNMLDMASSDKKSSFEGLDPFVVKRVIPMDVAPHTLRCEMVILCERLGPSEIPKSTRSIPKPTKKVTKKNSTKKKNWYGTANLRSNYFPTEDMVRRYSSVRKPKQEIDYQKRDSLYPPPLRGALYQGYEEESQYYVPEKMYPNEGYTRRRECNSRPSEDLSRYSDFRQDMESALDECTYYTKGKQLTTRKLAYANALLEEGIRIASEVLDDGYTQMPSSGYYNRQKVPRASNKYRY